MNGAQGSDRQQLGPWMATALVTGNMVGSGVFLLPAALAPFGWNAVLGWAITIAGGLCLAFAFARLAAAFPDGGGPYVFAREAFGPGIGFAVAWAYWISLWVGNAAIALAATGALAMLWPPLGESGPLAATVACALIWGLTAANCRGIRLAGQVQLATAILKLLPLVLLLGLAGWALAIGTARPVPFDAVPLSVDAVGGAAALSLWALLGLESATVAAGVIARPERLVPRATVIGTALAGGVYLLVCSAVTLIEPAAGAAPGGSPLASFTAGYLGGVAGPVIATAAAVAAIGALNGWILMQGELAHALAADGAFPRLLAERSPAGTPVRAHLLSSVLVTAMVLLGFARQSDRTLADLFDFFALLATTAGLMLFLACALAAYRLDVRMRIGDSLLLPPAALLGAVYAGWTLWSAGAEAVGWGAVLLSASAPVYALSQWREPGRRTAERTEEGRHRSGPRDRRGSPTVRP